jgi:SNF2 family DNA or RNA helicase
MKWLPKKDYQTIAVEMSDKQAKLYRQMESDFFIEDGETMVDTMTVLAQLTRMRQICLDPRLLGLNVKGAKTEAIVDYIDATNEPVVVMSMFTSYLELLKDDIKDKRIGMITGKMSSKQKFEVSEAFQRGEIDVLLCNIISAGVGFTLDKGEVIIFPDKAWNPADQEQAEDRITPTQEHKLHAHTILTFTTANTVDERIDDILKTKKDLTEVVNEGGVSALRRLLK